jgi:hypothetical protein
VPQPSAPPRTSTGNNTVCKYINAVQNKVKKDIWQNDQGIAFGNWYSLVNLGNEEDLGMASYIMYTSDIINRTMKSMKNLFRDTRS